MNLSDHIELAAVQRTNTTAELDFAAFEAAAKLSPAEILLNLMSWIEEDLGVQTSQTTAPARLSHEEARRVRVDTLLDVKNWLARLGAIEWV